MHTESCPTGEMAASNEGRQVGAARRHSYLGFSGA
jgi:hypothetical protein